MLPKEVLYPGLKTHTCTQFPNSKRIYRLYNLFRWANKKKRKRVKHVNVENRKSL